MAPTRRAKSPSTKSPARDTKSPARERRRSQSPSRRNPPKDVDALESGSPVAEDKKGRKIGKDKTPETGLKGDYEAIALLMLLYTLQGIPMGLSGSMGMMLAERKISTADQALFSMIALPFAFKLLWAPIVDSLYSSTFGRRKTWIVPVQAAIGLLLVAVAGNLRRTRSSSGSLRQPELLPSLREPGNPPRWHKHR